MAEPRIVCLHGLGRGPSDWNAVRDRLHTHGAVVTPALPRKMPRAVAAARQAVVPGAVLVGHSNGGIVALQIARDDRRSVAGVILTGCPFPVARNGRTRLATAVDYAGHRVAFVRSLGETPPLDEPRRRSPAGLAGIAWILARPERFQALFGSIGVPVLVVHARDDHHVPVDFALAASARHGWDVRVLETGGHHPHIRAPEAWTAAVEPWLSRAAARWPAAPEE